MKKILILFVIISIIAFSGMFSCDWVESGQKTTSITKTLRGKHKLRKLNTMVDSRTSTQGWFLLVAGGYGRNSSNRKMLYFAWQNNNNEYVISKLPLTKIRVVLKDNIKNPYIKFEWKDRIWTEANKYMERVFDVYVLYAIVYCRPDQWKMKIEMPLNKKDK